MQVLKAFSFKALILIPASASFWRSSQLLNSIKLILIPASVRFFGKFTTLLNSELRAAL